MNIRDKGARGEREWRDVLRAAGWQAERGQQHAGGADTPDVKTDCPYHFEVKRVQALNLEAACDQAKRDSSGKKPWAVAHRKNGRPWRITIDADLFLSLISIDRDVASIIGANHSDQQKTKNRAQNLL
jgi:Holliday junction resolvase